MTLAWSTSSSGVSIPLPLDALILRAERLLTSAATALPTSGGLGTVIEAYLRRLAGLADGLRPDIAVRLGMATMNLVATYFADLLGEAVNIDGAPQQTLLHQVKDHVEAHLGEPDLGPATIAAAQYISMRLLYRLFAADGITVAGWIRQRRLEHTRHDLTDPAYASSSITAIACRWRFIDSAHFSRRVFKAAYGISISTSTSTSTSNYRRSGALHGRTNSGPTTLAR